jgi:Ni/Fe-hydrogenase subunit HybB-like protein
LEKLPWKRAREWYLRWHHAILIELVLIGVVLSSLHQSFLGGLYLITEGKLYPLWYSSYIPSLFYLSAIPAGLAVTIMALYLSARSLNARFDISILGEISRLMAPLLAVYALFRGVDLVTHGALPYMFRWRSETGLFWLEIALFVLVPLVLLSSEQVRNNPQWLYWTCALVVMGFIANRLNVSVTGLQASAGVHYVPKWTEMASTIAILAAAVLAFRYAVLYLNIFPQPKERWMMKAATD